MEKKRMKQPRTHQRSCNGILVKNLFLLLLFCVSSFTMSSSWAQDNRHITLKVSNMALGDVIKELSKQTGKDFLYSNQEVNIDRKLSLALDKQELKAVLPVVFGANFDFEIKEKVVIIRPSLAKDNKGQQSAKQLSGKVVNESNVPMPGVTVHIKGTSIGVVTDDSGLFEIAAPTTPKALITVSFLGMKTEQITYKGEDNLRVVMREEVGDLTKVVVTGVFTKSRESYTGAVTTITAEEMQRAGSRSILSSIRNIDPSFNVIADNTMGSDPNHLPDITIRGRSSMSSNVRDVQTDSRSSSNLPLFIQDGFEISLTRMMDIDENQVESITLLKDASATAMYGTRGANGVVVIVTKRPEPGAINITYKGGIAIEAPDFTSYNLMNAKEKLLYEWAAGLYIPSSTEGVDPSQGDDAQKLLDRFNRRWLEAERGVDTYWLKYPVRTGVGHNHSLRLEGGEGAFEYSASIAYKKIAGAMKGSDREVFNGNVLLTYKYKNFKFRNDLQISHGKSHGSPYGSFDNFTKANSYYKPYDDEGNMNLELDGESYKTGSLIYINKIYNPLYNSQFKGIDESKYTQIKNNFNVEWNLNSDLILRGRLGITSQTSRSDKFISPNHTDFLSYKGDDMKRRGSYTLSWGESFDYEGDITLNYSKTFADVHQLYVGANANIAENTSENLSAKGEGIMDDNADFFGLAAFYEKGGKPIGSEGISRRMGGRINANYTYDLRYFVDFTATMEASSKFGSNNRTAPFWSAGAGWNLHRENFLEDNKILNLARLRVSYGTSGSQNFYSYQAMRTFKYFNVENYNGKSGAYLINIGNADLGWQKTKQLNVGTELEFFDKRIRLEVDVYSKLTNDMLADITLPFSSGFGSYKANIGKVSNKGIEIGLTAHIIKDNARGIFWSVGGKMVHNKNEIKEISNTLKFLNDQMIESDERNPSFLFQEGESMRTIFAVKSLGIDPANGREVYVKSDGSTTYNYSNSDKVPCGIEEPTWTGNMNTTIRYKNLSLTAIFGFNWGGQMYNQTLADKVENILPTGNADKRVLYDRWKQPGDRALYKGVKDFSQTNATSRFVADDNVFECRSLTLSYTLNNEWIKRNLALSYLMISANTEDLFRISSIKLERGLSYPYARKFSISLTARF